MPDLAVHYYFGQYVLHDLHDHSIDQHVFEYGLTGPDDWDLFGFPFLKREYTSRCSLMHTQKTGAFLSALSKVPALHSYYIGYLCHYILDSTCHPYISAFAGELSPETAQYRGNHMAFERALDNLYLSKNAPSASITSMIGEKLLLEFKVLINDIYQCVYGFSNAFDDLQKAKKGLKHYLRIVEDPSGLLKFLTSPIPHATIKALPYSRKYYSNADILNLSHQKWHHPNDPNLVFTSSFPELIDQANTAVIEILNGNHPIGNYSYLTGFDCDDPRNTNIQSFTPLERYC